MHEHASKMEIGDKETVAICIQASVKCYLHVIHSYTRIVYVPYAYGIQNYSVRVWYVPYDIIKYAYGTEQSHIINR